MAKRKLEMDIQLGQGTNDYNKLKNLPQINGVELKGNVNSDDLHIDYNGLTNKPQNLVQDANYVHTDNNFTNAEKSKLDNLNVGTGNLIIKRNNELLATFNANSTNDVEINLKVPTKSTDLSDSSDLVRQNEITPLETRLGTAEGNISSIQGVIPSDATANNKLVTESTVDNKIESMLAYYITKNPQGDAFATKAELTSATVFYSGGVVRVPKRNDYCYVLSDESQPADSLGNYPTTRYLYNNGWEFQLIVNNTSLTQTQLDALNSGINSTKVAQIGANSSAIESLHSAVGENARDIETLQGQAHTHSNKTVLDGISQSDVNNWNNKQNALSSSQMDAVNSGITSSDVAQIGTNTSNISNLQSGKQDKLTPGANITIDANNVISATGGGTPITVDSQLSTTSENPVQNKVITNALAGKQPIIDINNKLSADLVDDTSTTHKFVTDAEKTIWNNKLDAADLPYIINLIGGNT